MWHKIMTVSLFLAAVQGAALADKMEIPSPPPTAAGGTCPLLTECQASLESCQQDVDTLLPALAKCERTDIDTIKKKYDIGGGTTVKVVKRTPKTPRKPHKPKTPPKAPEVKEGPKGDPGAKGDQGDRGSDGLSSLLRVALEPKGTNCPNGGQHLMSGLDTSRDRKLQDEEVDTDVYICNGADGKSGSAGRPGKNGNTRVQFGLGMRTSAIWSADRPVGISAAPEAQLELWLAPTAEFVAGVAWAPEGDRNMVITSQLRWRALNKRVGLGLGVQYQAWNLQGNKALWQTVAGLASVQYVVIDSKYVDVSLDAGLLVGSDGYDSDAQAAVGGTGGLTFSLKL